MGGKPARSGARSLHCVCCRPGYLACPMSSFPTILRARAVTWTQPRHWRNMGYRLNMRHRTADQTNSKAQGRVSGGSARPRSCNGNYSASSGNRDEGENQSGSRQTLRAAVNRQVSQGTGGSCAGHTQPQAVQGHDRGTVLIGDAGTQPGASATGGQVLEPSVPNSGKILKGQVTYTVPQGTPIRLQVATVPTNGMKLLDRDSGRQLIAGPRRADYYREND